eukprot:312750-Pyramimonas_sp.AAC.1
MSQYARSPAMYPRRRWLSLTLCCALVTSIGSVVSASAVSGTSVESAEVSINAVQSPNERLKCSGYGSRSPNKECVCFEGFAGENCEHSAFHTCSNAGVPQDDGSCKCYRGFAGNSCGLALYPLLAVSMARVSVAEGGVGATYTVGLEGPKPTEGDTFSVKIRVVRSQLTQAMLSVEGHSADEPATAVELKFDAANWGELQKVNVEAVDD